jgi:drug/metabolite transporter (DMT)-like permease
LGASFSYASTTAFSRRATQGKTEPIVIAASTFLVAAAVGLVVMLLEPLLGGRAAAPLAGISSGGVFAVLMLGFLNTFVAYLFYYYIVHELGASRATMVTYVVPLIGLILGTLVRHEAIDAILIVGAILIVVGIAVANLNLRGLMRSMRTRFATS